MSTFSVYRYLFNFFFWLTPQFYTFAIYFSLLNIYTLPFLKKKKKNIYIYIYTPLSQNHTLRNPHRHRSSSPTTLKVFSTLLLPPKPKSLPFSFPQKPNSEIFFLKTKTKICNMRPLLFIVRGGSGLFGRLGLRLR